MLTYELKKAEQAGNGIQVIKSFGRINLTDDARGADLYLAYKRRGFRLARVASLTAEEVQR